MSVKNALRPIVDTYRHAVTTRLAGRRLQRLAQECDGAVGALVNLAFEFRYRSLLSPWPMSPIAIEPLQVAEELVELAGIVRDLHPKRVLEIGTARGGTLFLWACLARRNAAIVTVDLPDGRFGGGYPWWKTRFYEQFAVDGGSIHLVRGDSHEDATLVAVQAALGHQELDYLFIDGDHTYEGVQADYERYAGLVRKGGILALHDIAHHRPESPCEVDKFWAEIKNKHRHREIVSNPNQGWAGIGVLYM
jgi:predicted O-methyltransferase YrrM